jgi:hypothetical protein
MVISLPPRTVSSFKFSNQPAQTSLKAPVAGPDSTPLNRAATVPATAQHFGAALCAICISGNEMRKAVERQLQGETVSPDEVMQTVLNLPAFSNQTATEIARQIPHDANTRLAPTLEANKQIELLSVAHEPESLREQVREGQGYFRAPEQYKKVEAKPVNPNHASCSGHGHTDPGHPHSHQAHTHAGAIPHNAFRFERTDRAEGNPLGPRTISVVHNTEPGQDATGSTVEGGAVANGLVAMKNIGPDGKTLYAFEVKEYPGMGRLHIAPAATMNLIGLAVEGKQPGFENVEELDIRVAPGQDDMRQYLNTLRAAGMPMQTEERDGGTVYELKNLSPLRKQYERIHAHNQEHPGHGHPHAVLQIMNLFKPGALLK